MQARSIVLADMNGDGRLDLVAADYLNDILSVKFYENRPPFLGSPVPGKFSCSVTVRVMVCEYLLV